MPNQIKWSSPFTEWINGLKDLRARAKIQARLDRAELGNLGDWKPLAGAKGIDEMRIDYGPGYRVYFMRRGEFLIVLLAGGTKGTQKADMKRAIGVAAHWKD